MTTWRIAAVLGVLGLAACTAGNEESVGGSSAEVRTASDNGAGAGPARFDVDPCEHPEAFAKANKLNLIVMSAAQRSVDGTDKDDLIVGVLPVSVRERPKLAP